MVQNNHFWTQGHLTPFKKYHNGHFWNFLWVVMEVQKCILLEHQSDGIVCRLEHFYFAVTAVYESSKPSNQSLKLIAFILPMYLVWIHQLNCKKKGYLSTCVITWCLFIYSSYKRYSPRYSIQYSRDIILEWILHSISRK